MQKTKDLSVGLSDTLDFILLLDGIRVGTALGGVDDFVSQALGDALQVSERGGTCTGNHQVQGLVHATVRGYIDGLATDNPSRSDTGTVFTGARVGNSLDDDLNWILVGH